MKNIEVIHKAKEEALQPLLVSCVDTVDVYDRTTFFAYMFKNLRITYWYEEAEDEDERVAGMFDILFKEVMRRREIGKLIYCLKNKKL